MELTKLSDNKIQENLKELDGWIVQNGKLHKEIEFANFEGAWEFMTIAVSEIQKMNHHPEWFNVYNRITVELTTHDAGGITDNDVNLARILNSLF